MPRKGYINDTEMCKKIIEYWEKGLSYSQIAQKVDISRSVIGTVLRELRLSGFIQGRKVKLEPSVIVPGTVNCTTAVSKKCKYGIGSQSVGYRPLCNYALKVGKPRGCSHTACTKYCEEEEQKDISCKEELAVEGIEIYDKIEKLEKEVEREA